MAAAVWLGFLGGACFGATLMWVCMSLLADWEYQAILDVLRRNGVIK